MIPTFRTVVAIMTVAGRATLALLAIVVVLWALAAGSMERVEPSPFRAEEVVEHETIVRIPEGEFTKNLKVLDPAGRVLVTLNYFRHGDLVVSTGDSFQAHTGLWMGHDGSIESMTHVGSWETLLQSPLAEMPTAKIKWIGKESEKACEKADRPAPLPENISVP